MSQISETFEHLHLDKIRNFEGKQNFSPRNEEPSKGGAMEPIFNEKEPTTKMSTKRKEIEICQHNPTNGQHTRTHAIQYYFDATATGPTQTGQEL